MIQCPTNVQIHIAAALGIDIEGDSRLVAAARIADVVAEAIGARHGRREPTLKQVQFAESLGLDVHYDSLRVTSAKIAEELDRRNRERLVALNLSPGDQVVIRKLYDLDGRTVEWVRECTVSSIDVNGRLHFKGGNGAGAWPTEVEKLSRATTPLDRARSEAPAF